MIKVDFIWSDLHNAFLLSKAAITGLLDLYRLKDRIV